jgi:hypothetical protein
MNEQGTGFEDREFAAPRAAGDFEPRTLEDSRAGLRLPEIDLHDLTTYDLQSRPSKVFYEDLGMPVSPEATIGEWLDTLPRQLAGKDLRACVDRLCATFRKGRPIVAALGGHVIKTGCGPYLIDWIERGLVTAVAMNGSAAIHDFELGFIGKTSEDVAAQLPAGKFGMARETAEAFALATQIGTQEGCGLGKALGQHLARTTCRHPDASVVLAAFRAGIPCTIHVALGTDIVHMHPHVSGAALGESSLIDFRLLCRVVAGLADGLWMNLGSAVIMPEVFLKAVSVARNLGHNLDGLCAINLDKNANYRSRVNVVDRPATSGIELIGHHEVLIPLMHAAVTCKLAGGMGEVTSRAA